ncbi:MAG: hypothetical protein GTO53_11705 [Planctomycetales bacterium]|nr:hypothetical protein [Planctomycetales bacterium]NIM09776.1 hypothetical protein [Planctomycetales bacterium]NIN09245.1 hypothetical protein [Planctomycetales bacterium]NIN78345.1 hypothetical protein [Planctomycetales bacterium]NIO35524.1 hypothetical protein [Planctomycetales bacterium]
MQSLLKSHDRHSTPHPHFLPKFPTVQLEITRGRARDRLRPVHGRTFFIGSGPDCDLVLGDDHFPELHSYLLLTPEAIVIRHLGHQPALRVDGRLHSRATLTDQARIQIGPYEFMIHITGGQPADTALPSSKTKRPATAPHAACLTTPLPSTACGKNHLLDDVEQFFREIPPGRTRPATRLQLLDLAPATLDEENETLPVSIGLVSPSVKPPSWRHMSAETCVRPQVKEILCKR